MMGKLTSNLYLVMITLLCFLYVNGLQMGEAYVNGLQMGEAENEVKEIIRGRTYQRYFKENVLNVSSWNVENYDAKLVCDYVLRIKPKIMGFQDVTKRKAKEIYSCLGGEYIYYLGESDGSSYGPIYYNPIFYQNSIYVKFKKSGTFWLSDTPSEQGSSIMDKYKGKTSPRVCTWLKINFLQRQSVQKRRPNKFRNILNALRAFTGRSTLRRRVSSGSRYIWTSVYVANTKLESRDQDVAKQQMKIVMKHIRYDSSVMDRRGYPLIFMADLGWDYESDVYRDIEANGWLIDSLKYSARTFQMKASYRNFIMRFRLKSLMSATLYNSEKPTITKESRNRPVFAAYLSERSPVRTQIDDGMRNIVTGGK